MASITVENIKAVAHIVMRGWFPATQWDEKKINQMYVEFGPTMAKLRATNYTQTFLYLGAFLRARTIPLEKFEEVTPHMTRVFIEDRGIKMETLHKFFGMVLAEYLGEYMGMEIKPTDCGVLTVPEQDEISFIFITGWVKSLLGEETLKNIRQRIVDERLSEKPQGEVYKTVVAWTEKALPSYELIEGRFPSFRKTCRGVETSLKKIAGELRIERKDLVLKLLREAYIEIILEMIQVP